ncbi:MAG: hypothetical protein HYY04_05895 [Chloroflexi bacterium]|nr:hypothetical protein [Chloroflexota bacterium]
MEQKEVSVAVDVRGADWVGDAHHVVLSGLTASTTYQFVLASSPHPIGNDGLLVESTCGGNGFARQKATTAVIDDAAGFGDLGDRELRPTATEQVTLVNGCNLLALPVEPPEAVTAVAPGRWLVSQVVSTIRVVAWNAGWGRGAATWWVGRATTSRSTSPRATSSGWAAAPGR